MFSRKTKKSKGNGVIAPLVVGLLGVSCFALWHALSLPSFAANPSDTTEGIVVTGVSNVTEYLTSLVLYTDDPMSKTAVVLKYDADLNALIIDGAINADALSIGSGNQINGSGNVILGGEKNIISNSNSNYSAIVGGKGNTINGSKSGTRSLTGSVIVGGEKNTLKNVNPNSLIIGGYLNTGDVGEYQVFLGGTGSKGTNNAKYFLVLGEGGNTVSSNSILMGGKIQGDKDKIFVWSDSGTFIPNYSNAFYVNTTDGFGLNTSSPKLKLDLRESGVLYIKKETQINANNQVLGLECSKNKPEVKGTIAYINNGISAGLCGCNGNFWVPLSIDSFSQFACASGSLSTTNCEGNPTGVIKNTSKKGTLRWYSDGNNGSGGWKYPDWTYGGVESPIGGDRECSYTCLTGYAPRTGDSSTNWDPTGWFTGNCVPCTDIEDKYQWKTPGSKVDDCDFSCKAGYKYDKQTRTCTLCSIGEWTATDNQTGTCSRCETPKGTANVSSNSGTGGTLKDGTPYFGNFVSVGTGGNRNSCKFTCLSGFYVSYQNNPSNACVQCGIGQWSDGGSVTSCSSCTNKPDGISFKWKNYQDDTSWNSGTLGQIDAFDYTSMGSDGPTSCEWKCRANLGLVREGDSCVCADKENTHLEKVGSETRCVPNVKNWVCGAPSEGSPDASTITGSSIASNVGGNGNWTGWQWNGVKWKYITYEEFVSAGMVLGDCEWTCPQHYRRNGNSCLEPEHGKCSSSLSNKYISSSAKLNTYRPDQLCESSNGVGFTPMYIKSTLSYRPSDGGFVGSEDVKKADGWWLWRCNGEYDEYSVECYAYVEGTAKKGQCDYSIGGEPSCLLNSLNLHKPVLTGYSEYGDGRTWQTGSTDTWLNWKCPGQYGGEMVNCGFCGSGYTFHPGSQRCYVNTRQINCFQGTNPATWPAKGYIHGTGVFTQNLDTSEADYKYLPETKRTYTSDTVVENGTGLSTCKYTCDTGYHVKDSDKKCYANSYTIEYYHDGNKVGSSTHYYNTSKSLTSASSLGISKDGYSFYGWSLTDKNFVKTYADKQSVLNLTENDGITIKLYAIMYKTVHFYSSTNMANDNKTEGYYNNGICRVTTPGIPTSLDGWSTLGWRNDTDANVKTVDSTSMNVLNNCSTNFYAVYSRTANFYSGKDGTKSTSTQYYNTAGNYKVSIPSGIPYSITTPSWTALGRRTDTDAKDALYNTTYTSLTSSSKDFYAVYSRTSIISYKGNGSNGGDTPPNSTSPQYFNSNGSVSTVSILLRPNTFTRAGYSFNGWDLGAEYSFYSWTPGFSDSATKDAKAQWTTNGYSITYTLNGGTNDSSNPSSYTIESETITLKDPTRSGYTFKGRTGNNGTTPQKGVKITKGTTGNKSYTANWTVVNYSISYNLGGGSVSIANKTSYTVETNSFTLNNPVKDGYAFVGWTGSNGPAPQTSVTISKGSTGDRLYSAMWAFISTDGRCGTEKFTCAYGTTGNVKEGSDVQGYTWECSGTGTGKKAYCGIKWDCQYSQCFFNETKRGNGCIGNSEDYTACSNRQGNYNACVNYGASCCNWVSSKLRCWKNGSSSEDTTECNEKIWNYKPTCN